MVDCPTCLDETGESKDFNSKGSMRQHHTLVHNEQLPNTSCENCGTEFYEEHKASYCDDCECDFSGENNPNYSGAKETTNCKECGEEFEYYPSEKKGIFCKKCVENTDYYSEYIHHGKSGKNHPSWKGGKTTTNCKECGDEFKYYPNKKKGLYCSNCYANGEDHYNWSGGDGYNYYTGKWNKVKRKCLERDDYTCQNCGKMKEELGRNPDVHHIKSVSSFEEEQNAHYLENLVCLCKSCHGKVESDSLELSDDVLP